MYGTDLAHLIARHRWAAVVDLVHQLPKASRTWEAVVTDPELAAQMVAAQERDTSLDADDDALGGDDGPGWAPQYREHDLHAKMLGDLIDAVAALNQTVIAIGGGKAHKPEPYPTPHTALPQGMRDQAREDALAIHRLLGIHDPVTNEDQTPESGVCEPPPSGGR